MALKAYNHLFISTTVTTTSTTWAGETANWGWRVAVSKGGVTSGRGALVEGQNEIATVTRTVTLNTHPMDVVQGFTTDGKGSSPGSLVRDSDLDYLAGNAVAFWDAISSTIGSNWRFSKVAIYAVDSSGHSPNGVINYTPQSAMNGAAASYLTPEIAQCVSLYSAERSKLGRGRFYIGPLSIAPLTSEGIFSSSWCNTILTSISTQFNGIRAHTTSGGNPTLAPIIWSRTDKTKGCVVSRIRVGDEPDHQERRTKKRPETYYSVNLTD